MSIAGKLRIGPPYRWDDLRVPATSIPLQGQTGDPDRDVDGSLLYDASSVELSALIYQLPHGWEEGTPIRFHLHWGKSTDAAGDVVWQMRYRIWNNGEVPPDWSEWLASTDTAFTVGADQTSNITAWAEIDMTGQRISSLISIQFRRKADDAADTYAADARLWDADCHYRANSIGSEEEYPT